MQRPNLNDIDDKAALAIKIIFNRLIVLVIICRDNTILTQ